MGRFLEFAIAALNGAVGDYLVRTGNGLATSMMLAHEDRELPLDRASLRRARPEATGKIVVLLHGLMCTEAIWSFRGGDDYGQLLAKELGYTPWYVRYNTGLPIPDNGRSFARLLSELVANHPVPVEEILLLGYSMGGLVARAGCHVAAEEGLAWLPLVKKAIYVGTPHRGAPLERYARFAQTIVSKIDDPYARLVVDIASMRSAGVKDLGDADLRPEDRAATTGRFSLRDRHHPVPLLPSIEHYLIAGTLSPDPFTASFFGDAIVPVPSSTNGASRRAEPEAFPPDHVVILPGKDHLSIAQDAQVWEAVRRFAGGT